MSLCCFKELNLLVVPLLKPVRTCACISCLVLMMHVWWQSARLVAQKLPVRSIIRLLDIGVSEINEELFKCGVGIRRDLDTNEHLPDISSVIAVVEG
jgi:hypothetical protein